MKKITMLNTSNQPDMAGSVIKIEDTDTTSFTYDGKGDFEIKFSKSGNVLSLTRKSDNVLIVNAMFNQILNGNANALFGSAAELQNFVLNFIMVSDGGPTNANLTEEEKQFIQDLMSNSNE